MNDNDTTSASGEREVGDGGALVTYGVGVDSPVRRLWVLAGNGKYMIHADALSLAPKGAADKELWLRANLGRLHEFMRATYGLEQCIAYNPDGSREEAWDENGDLWFTAYVYGDTDSKLTEKQAYDLAVSETKLVEVKERAAYVGVLYREYLGELWARGDGEHGTVVPSEQLATVFHSSLSANLEDDLGFDALYVKNTAEEEAKLAHIVTVASGHPMYIDLADLNLDEDSDDLDAVNDIAYVIMRDTLARLGY